MNEAFPQYRLLVARTGTFAERSADVPFDVDETRSISYSPQFRIGFEEKTCRVQVGALVHAYVTEPDAAPVEDESQPTAEVEVVCVFEFQSLDPFRVDGKVQVPRPLLAHMVGMTLSTARGVLIGRSRHPLFQLAPLPIVSPRDFIGELVAGDGFEWVGPGETTAE